jgi:hypothetical protein
MFLTNSFTGFRAFFLSEEDTAADATDAPQPYAFLCNPIMKMMINFRAVSRVQPD